MGTKSGYRLFSVTAVDKLDCIHEGGRTLERFIIRIVAHEHVANNTVRQCKISICLSVWVNTLVHLPVECPDVYIVERLFSSSLVVVVSLSMPRRMNVYHFKKGTEICNYSYSNNILSVRLNRQVRGRRWSSFVFLTTRESCHTNVCVTVSSAVGGVSGGVHLHPQHQGHEAT